VSGMSGIRPSLPGTPPEGAAASAGRRLRALGGRHSVPILFALLCLFGFTLLASIARRHREEVHRHPAALPAEPV